MQRRDIVRSLVLTGTAALASSGAFGAIDTLARRRRRRGGRGSSAAAGASATVTGPNGATSVFVACNGEQDSESDSNASQASCRD